MSTQAWKDIEVIRIGRSTIVPWQPDPRISLLQRHVIGLVMVPPTGLGKFISADPAEFDEVQFVHGPKGSGKTSLLLAKRKLLDEAVERREVLCIPNAFPFVFTPFMDDIKINFDTWESLAFAEKEAWKYAWLVLLGAFVLKALDEDKAQSTDSDISPMLSERLVKVLTGERGKSGAALEEKRWVAYLKNLVENAKSSPVKQYKSLYESEIMPHLAKLNVGGRPIWVFVDGVDETFCGPGGSPLMKLVKANGMKALSKAKTLIADQFEDDPNTLARKVWVNAQTSLLDVATEFSLQSNSNVRLFGSMRSEAFRELGKEGGQAIGQRANLIKAIEYSRSHLEAIFRANIRASLKLHDKDRGDEFKKFFGINDFLNKQIGITEPIFQYLRRHTLEEPRDLMIIGKMLDDVPITERSDVSRIVEEVRQASLKILADYFRFMDENWEKNFEDAVFPYIEKNILTIEDAQLIAASVTKDKMTQEEHPFCYLYKRGLIGVVDGPDADGRVIQKFQRAALVEEANRSKIPKSVAYFIHPLLESRIAQARESARVGKLKPCTGLIVGQGMSWIPGFRAKRVQLGLDGNRVKLKIDDVSLSTPIGASQTGAFNTVADIPTAIFISCLLQMVDLSQNEPEIVAVMYEIEKFVNAGYLKKRIKRDAELKDTAVFIKNTLESADRHPSPLETISKRLKAYHLDEITIGRSRRGNSLSIKGISWEEIEITTEGVATAMI